MRPIIGVMGTGSGGISVRQRNLAEEIGNLIAKKGLTLLTGAGLGIPLIAANAAKSSGGKVIGISPAASLAEHAELGLPIDPFEDLIFTGLGFIGRNAVNIYTSDIIIFIGGEHGTLNEFTIAYQQDKIIGILDQSGGITDLIEEIIKKFTRKTPHKNIIIESDPGVLLKKTVAIYYSRLKTST
ncbi:LOG family protein [Candidatus Peregrinibacteria bacterium]|nr:LOG family protein [Candidatus Peregrinibacteria bacterium]